MRLDRVCRHGANGLGPTGCPQSVLAKYCAKRDQQQRDENGTAAFVVACLPQLEHKRSTAVIGTIILHLFVLTAARLITKHEPSARSNCSTLLLAAVIVLLGHRSWCDRGFIQRQRRDGTGQPRFA